ncbi:class I SAM-dependent methyltransferase [Kribbella sp. NPDC004875]|uniref:class I SAM-dependent methyltransferase n=1 Tax=Kribbella sp. NPDC004875 TaxID=3364107 RepID=UPI0036BCBDB2
MTRGDLHVLPDLTDKDVIDLGCGTAYIGAWVKRAGGRPVGIDNSAEQLATAESLQQKFDCAFPLIHGNSAASSCSVGTMPSKEQSIALPSPWSSAPVKDSSVWPMLG